MVGSLAGHERGRSTEADGLSDFWLRKADKQIKIPMRGKIDSLYVSGSCAIMIFEVGRQRGFEG